MFKKRYLPPITQLSHGPYAERMDSDLNSWDRRLAAVYSRILKPLTALSLDSKVVTARIEFLGAELSKWSDELLKNEVKTLSRQLRRAGLRHELVIRAFAVIRELSSRILGKRHYPVQLWGGLVLLRGEIAEMQTGEGKTLTATLAAGVAAMAGIPVHVVTVNDYLAARDAEEMGPLYRALGFSVGAIQNDQSLDEKRHIYGADITYCTNKELGFDYLRDRLQLKEWPSATRISVARTFNGDDKAHGLLLRGLHFAIVDEADSVLIDEARTPLIISGQGNSGLKADVITEALKIATVLRLGQDFELLEKQRTARLKPAGIAHIKQFAKELPLLTGLGSLWIELVTQALAAINFYQRDKHYLVKDDQVQIVDEYTGRLMPDRSWEQGLHQLIEVKEGCTMTNPRETLARITYQRFFRRYLHLSGMTGTATEVAEEFWSVYRLKVTRIPTHKPMQRHEFKPRLAKNQHQKWQAVVAAVQRETIESRRPVLIGTRSVEASEQLSSYLMLAGVAHQVLNARQDAEEAQLIEQAGQANAVTVATNMAGRGTDIKLGEGVAEAGGLHVILTEFHDAGRIDRQLYGRCGRQGDPGSFQAIVAADDELFRFYAAGWLHRFIAAELMPASVSIHLFRKISQFRAEKQHAEIRNQTLDLDRQIDRMLSFSGRH